MFNRYEYFSDWLEFISAKVVNLSIQIGYLSNTFVVLFIPGGYISNKLVNTSDSTDFYSRYSISPNNLNTLLLYHIRIYQQLLIFFTQIIKRIRTLDLQRISLQHTLIGHLFKMSVYGSFLDI